MFLWINVAVVPLALWWYTGALRLRTRERVLLLFCCGVFASAQESVRGGNLDGVMLALMSAAFSVRRRVAGALWLAVGIGLKLYSVILLPVLLRRRQWRFVLWTLLALFLVLLPFCRLWPAALHALFVRDARFLNRSIPPPILNYGNTDQ